MSTLEGTISVPRSRRRGIAWAALLVGSATVAFAAYKRGDHQDLAPVWLALHRFHVGMPPYTVRGFLYPPSALLVLMPLGWFTYSSATVLTIALSSASIVATGLLCLRLLGVWRGGLLTLADSVLAPLLLLALMVSGPAITTLHLLNVNGLIAVLEGGALLSMARGRWNLGGVLLGLSAAIKPVLLPLVLLPAIQRRVGAVLLAAAVPVLLTVTALPFTNNAGAFFTTRIAYLWQGDQNAAAFNVSLANVGSLLHIPAFLSLLGRLAVVAVGLAALAVRLRRQSDPGLDLVDASAILLLVAFLSFSFSHSYYALLLAPFLTSLTLRERRWLLWNPALVAGLILLLVPVEPAYRHLGDTANTVADVQACLGFLLLWAALCTVILRPVHEPAAGASAASQQR